MGESPVSRLNRVASAVRDSPTCARATRVSSGFGEAIVDRLDRAGGRDGRAGVPTTRSPSAPAPTSQARIASATNTSGDLANDCAGPPGRLRSFFGFERRKEGAKPSRPLWSKLDPTRSTRGRSSSVESGRPVCDEKPHRAVRVSAPSPPYRRRACAIEWMVAQEFARAGRLRVLSVTERVERRRAEAARGSPEPRCAPRPRRAEAKAEPDNTRWNSPRQRFRTAKTPTGPSAPKGKRSCSAR